MRFYRITITDPKSGAVIVPAGFGNLLGGASFTSFVNNKTIAGAWDIELDIPVIDAATSQGFAILKIWGISQDQIAQANDLAGKNIVIEGGMKKGLPLANPAQAGQLTSGTIFQSFGNWIGTDQRLDFIIMPGPPATSSSPGGIGTLAAPKNLSWFWPAGAPMSQALQSCLSTAFPGATINISISPNLVRSFVDQGPYPTLEVFSQYIKRTSRDIIKTSGYLGVSIAVSGNAFNVSDGSTAAPAGGGDGSTPLEFQDLIGQPTWIQAPVIQIKTVMRADLSLFGKITLPPTRIINTQQAQSSLINQRASFQGTFDIIAIRHVGRFRNPSYDAWVTVIEAVPSTT